VGTGDLGGGLKRGSKGAPYFKSTLNRKMTSTSYKEVRGTLFREYQQDGGQNYADKLSRIPGESN